MINKIRNHYKTTAFILGAITTFSLSPFYQIYIAFITFGYLFYALNQNTSKKQSFSTGYWFGFGFYACSFSWVGNALLVDPIETGWLYPICLLASGSFFGLFIGLPALISSYFKNTYHKYFALISSIVLFEWIRSWIFTGFPWNPIGSIFGVYNILMQIASIGGIFFLSLIVLYIITLPSLYIITKNKKTLIILILLIITTLSFGFYRQSLYQYTPSQTKVRLVQPSIPQTAKWSKETLEDNFNKHIEMSAKDNNDINLTIWGETASPFVLQFEPEYLQQITKAVPQNGYLMTGLIRYEKNQDGKYQPLNSMAIINKEGKIINHYNKTHLVPFGEYIPLRKYLPEFIKPVANIIGEFKRGDGPQNITLDNIPTFSTSICYEIIFPNANIDRKNKPEILINLTNDGWYGDSSGPRQHLLSAQFRAIEEGVIIIRVANNGISAIISPTGNVIAKLDLNKKDVLDFYLPKQTTINTAYPFLQNYLILMLILLTLITITIKETRNGK